MIELRNFEGTPEELAEFCVRTWRQVYSGTDMPFPLWSGPFMEWENFGPRDEDRGFLSAAYDGTKLVGVLPARRLSLKVQGEVFPSTVSSYLSVDPEYNKSGVAMKLIIDQRRRHRRLGAEYMLGYVYTGASAAKGSKFWFSQPKLVAPISKVGLWARVLDHGAVARFERMKRDRWGVRMLGLFQGAPKPPRDESGIRLYEPRDLDDCRALGDLLGEGCDISYVWEPDLLERQLAFPSVPTTLVAEEDGRVTAMANYCRLEFNHVDERGDSRLKVGLIDLLSLEQASPGMANKLLRSLLYRIHQEGCEVALMLRLSCYPTARLFRHGFVMQPADYWLAICKMGGRDIPAGMKNFHIHWR